MAGPKYGKIDQDYAMQLATTAPESDGPIWMVNLMKYHDLAQYEDGRTAQVSGREADNLYAPLKPLEAIGAEIVYIGDVDSKLLGDHRNWDRIAVVKYPTRNSFVAMQSREDFQKQHVHKEAGMQETIVMGCLPIDLSHIQEPTNDWKDVRYPPTEEDGPIVVLHVLKFDEDCEIGKTPEKMEEYTKRASKVALKHGIRPSGWFGVEGTIVGDGRKWDQVRFNAFPSKAAFLAVAGDPERRKAQEAFRNVSIMDTYTLIVRTTIDNLAPSIVG